jgi:glycosyltransferase involved in cell wall biosynthesis
MLQEWSLGRSRMKKFVAWHLWERENLAAAQLFHATSEAEATSLRKIRLRQPIAIIPNGVDIPDPTTFPSRRILEQKHPQLVGRRWALFLSRIHPKKGVSELIAAWRDVERQFPGWHLILAGPDLDGYGVIARREVAALAINQRVTFTGMLAEREKEAALANAEIFVLPTHSENFGIAVAEALAYGMPVITTKNAPWPELESHRCGWWIDLEHTAIKRSIEDALRLSPDDLREMGRRGRVLMQEKFSWKRVAEQMKDSYQWLLGRADKPNCVDAIS